MQPYIETMKTHTTKPNKIKLIFNQAIKNVSFNNQIQYLYHEKSRFTNTVL